MMTFDSILGYLSILLTFGAVSLLIFGLGRLFSEFQVNKRLKQLANKHTLQKSIDVRLAQTSKKWNNLLGPLQQLSLPRDGWNASTSRLKFIRAGFRQNSAPSTFFAIKTLLFFAFPLLCTIPIMILIPDDRLMNYALYLLMIAGVGYYLPDTILNYITNKRSADAQNNLPDLMDLLVICSEAGMGLDSALNRVSVEIRRSSAVLSEEFYLACLEIRAGSSRISALKNLSTRVNIEDLHALVAMLVQADKFGTSLGESLRIQSEFMRVKRMQRAEEIAAKVPVKMLFPLVFMIFPTLMMVLLGPAIIQIGEAFKP